MLDPTQIILAIIAILGTIVTALLTGIGAILLFVGNHFVNQGKYYMAQIAALQAENKKDRETHYAITAGLIIPFNTLVENDKEHTENTKASLENIEAIAEKMYKERHKQ